MITDASAARRYGWFALCCLLAGINPLMAGTMTIDDRSSGTLRSSDAGEWRLITDQVMGGRSTGEMFVDRFSDRSCLRMRGAVSTANNGGFVQLALDFANGESVDASGYDGIELEVAGNGERYNLHLRTRALWLPWQSYRAGFDASPEWRRIRIPFRDFEPYRTGSVFDAGELVRIGIVAIGRPFDADVCIGRLSFYRGDAGD